MATAKDRRDKRVDSSAADHPIDSSDVAVEPATGGLAEDLPEWLDTDLLGLSLRHPANGVRVLVVDGELDALTAPLLGACLREQFAAVPAHLILDLQSVRFLGSSGLNCLLDARELVAQSPRVQLHIAGLISPAVARPMAVTGLVDRFDTYPTVADALTALAQ